MHKRRQRILVSDFDGTMTKFDFFDLARRDLPSNADHDFWQDYVDGQITHFEALQGIFGSIRADWAGIEKVLAGMQLDPTLKDSVARLRAAGWEIVVASAGCGWYIERLLRQAGVELDVHANPGEFAPETGLRLALPTDSPYFKRETGIDKPAIVRAALMEASLVLEGWRCVLLLPLFADATRQRVGLWRALLRMKAVVEVV